MTGQNFTLSFTVGHPAEAVFKAITNVRGRWTGDIDGTADAAGAEFVYRYQDSNASTPAPARGASSSTEASSG
jgi:hypothetical protein